MTVIELHHLWAISSVSGSPQTQLLTLYYGATLILSVGLPIALLTKIIFSMAEWGLLGVPQNQFERWASWGALPLTALALSATLIGSLSVYEGADYINHNYSGYFWLIPCGSLAAYFWFVTKYLINQIDQKFQGPWSAMTSLALTVLILILGYHFAPTTVQQTVTTWPNLALILGPLFTFVGVGLSFLTPDRQTLDKWSIRVVVGLFSLTFVGLIDLSEYLNRYEIVKGTLIEESLMSSTVIHSLQPLFDQDGDGVAGKLAGADCDDGNPSVYPGAPEIPLNGIDEDCFGGDLLPPQQKIQAEAVSKTRLGSTVNRPNIILITIDTLRADHLHYHGYLRKTSPFLDILSRRGLNFQWAFSTGAQTRTSMPAVFVGRYYSEVSRSKGDWATIYPDNLTLAERLRAAGYQTVGIPSHNYFNPSYGLNQGFEEWNFDIVSKSRQEGVGFEGKGDQRGTSYQITGGSVTDAAIKWFDQRDSSSNRPFFLWMHYFDPHHIYRDHPHLDFRSQRDRPPSPVDLYDEEIRYTDEQIQRFFEMFDLTPFAQNTYVMIHSDHGEGFGEHGYQFHGQSLNNDQVHVPLLLYGPRLPAQTIDTPVSLIDVMPTLLELAQVSALPPEPRGSSLLKFSYQANADHHPIIIEMLKDSTHSSRRSIVDWPWKLHYSRDYNRFRFFNLRKDPLEEIDIYSERSPALKRVRKRLMRFLSEETTPIEPFNR